MMSNIIPLSQRLCLRGMLQGELYLSSSKLLCMLQYIKVIYLLVYKCLWWVNNYFDDAASATEDLKYDDFGSKKRK